MKIPLFLCLSLAVFHAQSVSAAPPKVTVPSSARSPAQIYEEARRAYYSNDYATAKVKLIDVLKTNPNFQPAVIMLNSIRSAEAAEAMKAASLESRMKRASLPTLDLDDEPIRDVLEYLRIRASQQASLNGQKPNMVIKLDPQTEKRRVSLHFGQVSLYDALHAAAAAANLEVLYTQFAITIQPKGAEPPAAPEKKPAEAR